MHQTGEFRMARKLAQCLRLLLIKMWSAAIFCFLILSVQLCKNSAKPVNVLLEFWEMFGQRF